MKRLFLILFLCLVVAAPVLAGSIAATCNDESVYLSYRQPLKQSGYGQAGFGLRGGYDDSRESFLGNVEFGVKGTPGNVDGLSTEVMFEVAGTGFSSEKVLGVGAGLRLDYAPPMLTGFGFSAEIHYTPEILTFMDAESYFETGAGIRYALMPNATLLLTYQNVLIDFEDYKDVRWTDTFRFGIQLNY